MNGNIEHNGIITAIEGYRIDVTVVAESACASCKAQGVCGKDEKGEKVIPVWHDHPEYFAIGEMVVVSMTRIMGVKAVVKAYIYPFFIMLATLMILTSLEMGDVIAGLSSLGSVVLYYLFLYVTRNKVEKEIIFKITKQL